MTRSLFLAIVLSCYVWALPALAAAPYQPSNPKIDPVARRVFDYIGAVQGKFILSGQYEDSLNMKAEHLESPDLFLKYTRAQMETVQRITGKLPAIRGFDIRAELGPVENDPVIDEILASWRDNRQIITICWHAGAPPLEDTYPNSVKKTYGLIPILLTSGTPENIAFLKKLDLIAAKLQRLRDAGVPVLWRPYHEISGGWFWWSQGTTVDIKDLWKFTYKYLTEKKHLHNLIWVWSSPDAAEKECYPGNDFVDIAACDVYPRYPQATLSRWDSVYAELVSITAGAKPIALSENDIIPNPNDMFAPSSSTRFSWFATWRAPWLTYNSDTYLRMVYNHAKVLTLDEIPSFGDPPRVEVKLPGEMLRAGEHALLTCTRTYGTDAVFQWFAGESGDESSPVAGATTPTWTTPPITGTATYWLRIVDPTGIYKSDTIRLNVVKPGAVKGSLSNMSIRTTLVAGSSFTLGFVVGDDAQSQYIVRAIGPGLAKFNVPNLAVDPHFALFGPGAHQIADNDDWDPPSLMLAAAAVAAPQTTLAGEFGKVGAFGLDPGSRDAAGSFNLGNGPFTAIAGNRDGGGEILVELYRGGGLGRFVNFSGLAELKGSESPRVTAGFFVEGSDDRYLLIRAVGEGLKVHGVENGITKPAISVFNDKGRVVNQALGGDIATAQIHADAASRVGAFNLNPGSSDAVLIAKLASGAYTVQASSAEKESGKVLLEIYDIR